jgi:hypothetical protein
MGKKVTFKSKPDQAAPEHKFAVPSFHNPNTEWYAALSLAIDKIKGTFGADIVAASPLTGEHGFTAPIDEKLLEEKSKDPAAKSGSVIYSGGINIFWANPLESLTPSVAINEKAVKNFMKNNWPPGVVKPLDQPIDIRIDSQFPLPRGALVRLSPEELQHALILKVAERISQNAGGDELEVLPGKIIIIMGATACTMCGGVTLRAIPNSDL